MTIPLEQDPRPNQVSSRPFSADPLPWILLGGSLILRLVLVPAPGWRRDVYWFGTWMRTAVEHGAARVSELVWCDYPPGYLYLLEGTGHLWNWFTGGPIPADETVALRYLVKLPPNLADLAAACVLYSLAAPRIGRRAALVVLVAYAFNPAMLFNSAVWGQADSVTALLLLLSGWAVCGGRVAAGFAVAAATVFVKLQAVAVLPALVLVAFRLGGRAALFAGLRGAVLASLVLMLPFYWAGRADSVIRTALGATERYPYISMNAHNVWWLFGGADSMHISDAMRVGAGHFTYHAVGMIMLGTASLLILWRLWSDLRRGPERPFLAYFESAALLVLAFYLFPTQMHERYLVPVVALLAAACIWRPRLWWLYGAGSLAVFVSLLSTLHDNYPLGSDTPLGLGHLAEFLPEGRGDTFAVAVLLTALFVGLLLSTPDRRFRLLAPPIACLVASIAAALALLPLPATTSLADWQPIEASQSWGKLRHNRTVDGNRLAASGFIFRRGIGTHAVSRLTYDLNGAFRIFDTAFALDTEANRGQKIRFRILVDGDVRFDSGDISGFVFPQHARVSVEGADRLTLEVLDGGDGIHSDHADWLEPVLLR
jgi:Gpi18-like mannosyltransferase